MNVATFQKKQLKQQEQILEDDIAPSQPMGVTNTLS